MSKTVAMVRGEQSADVHPAEVDHWSAYGWVHAGDAPESTESTESTESAEGEEGTEEGGETLRFAVYRVVDGERNERASRANLTAEEAEAYVAERPDAVFEIVADDD